MTTARRSIASLLMGMFAISGSWAYGADSTPSPTTQADLDNAIAKTLAQEDAARSEITSLLQRDDVRTLAEGYGLDTRRAEAAVGTLQGDELQRLSQLAASADVQLAGGDTVIRISLVALLLIVIIVILLVK